LCVDKRLKFSRIYTSASLFVLLCALSLVGYTHFTVFHYMAKLHRLFGRLQNNNENDKKRKG